MLRELLGFIGKFHKLFNFWEGRHFSKLELIFQGAAINGDYV